MFDMDFLHDLITRRQLLKRGFGTGVTLVVAPPLLKAILAVPPPSVSEMPGWLSKEQMEMLLKAALARGGDFADIFVERKLRRNIEMDGGNVGTVHFGIDQGAGIRVIEGDRTGYAFSDDLSMSKLMDAARVASEVAHSSPRSGSISIAKPPMRLGIGAGIPLESATEKDRLELMKRADAAARDYDTRIVSTTITNYDETRKIAVANSNGLWVEDEKPIIYFTVWAQSSDGARGHRGRNRVSATKGMEFFKETPPETPARAAASEAVAMLEAEEAPSGEMPVVVEGGWGGVMFHEAVGHGLEGDAVRAKTSFYHDKLGQRVASEQITLIDDGSLTGLRGSANVDDEGTPTRENVLIENGMLKGYMHDLLSARQLGAKPTGNGRRESYKHYPLVRMTNTFIRPGSLAPEEIFESTKKGLYAKGFWGGVVDTASGNFTFSVREAYLIEEGKVTKPVRGATLIGNGPEALKSIDMLGNNLGYGPGTCGKDQWVPVTSGQPTLRLSKITVGGTKSG
jgi:TldD protein